MYQKKIMYFTSNDNPHGGKPNMQNEAVQKFKDLGKVQLNVVAFNQEFSFQNFYSVNVILLLFSTVLNKSYHIQNIFFINRAFIDDRLFLCRNFWKTNRL